MSFEFARRMEREADRIANRFKNDISGIKPWYSYAGLFDEPTTRVFVGLNPGGSSESEELDKRYRNRERVYTETGFNAWLDEVWEGASLPGASVLQKRAHRAFQDMYGSDDWEHTLRNTPCFNVVPFRTSSSAKLPSGAWNAAQPWFRQILQQLQPKLIICDGSGEDKSAWAALRKFNVIRPRKSIPTASTGRIKYGHITSGPLKGARVVALPHLSKKYFWPDDDSFQKLRGLRESRPSLFV